MGDTTRDSGTFDDSGGPVPEPAEQNMTRQVEALCDEWGAGPVAELARQIAAARGETA